MCRRSLRWLPSFGTTCPRKIMSQLLFAAISLVSSGSPKTEIQAGRTIDVQIPNVLDCHDSPEWSAFREAVIAAASAGFPKSEELKNQAAALEEKWSPWICDPSSGRRCVSSADLTFEFVRELDYHCRDSNNFERYLIRHYFHNTQLAFERLHEPSGFCLYGYATALVVLAWHAFPEHVGEALIYLYTARHLAGHYHSFDYFESSSWPVSSFLMLLNLQHGGNEFVPFLTPPEYGHPGQYGTNWYYDRLRWNETSESSKIQTPIMTSWNKIYTFEEFARLQAPSLPFERQPNLPRVTVWQFCIHTSTAGEAVTMITRFLRQEFEVEFRGNSVAFQLCGNYQPSLCPPARNADFIDWFATQFMIQEISYNDLVSKFYDRLISELLEADVWMCSIPAVWCRVLADVDKIASGNSVSLSRPIFAYLGLPILQYVADVDRADFLISLKHLIEDPRSVVVANNAYLAEEVLWQTGLRVPTLRIHGLHTNATYMVLKSTEVIISRPGTSGGWQECLLNRFLDSNPEYPLRFVQFTDLLDPHTTKEVYNMSLSYPALGQYRALVSFPYDTSLMLFWEFYSMNVPVFVPFQLWRWGIFGQHTRPDLEEPTLQGMDGAPPHSQHFPPHSPFFDGFSPLDLSRALYWSKYTDWAMFPHVQYFTTLAELMVALLETDLAQVSADMKRFNEECLVQTVEAWRHVVLRWHWARNKG